MSIATAVRPRINEEFLIGHNGSSLDTLKRIVGLLAEKPSAAGAIAKAMNFTSRHATYALSTLGYLGFADYSVRGMEHVYYLTEAGEELASAGNDQNVVLGAPLTESALAYLLLVDGIQEAASYLQRRYGISESNARDTAYGMSALMAVADTEAIIAHGHPSLHDENYDTLYVSHGSHAVVKPEEKLTFCPIHFISLPATGICEDCGGEPEAVAKLTPSMDGKKCDCCATPFERGEKNCSYCAKHSRFCPVSHP